MRCSQVNRRRLLTVVALGAVMALGGCGGGSKSVGVSAGTATTRSAGQAAQGTIAGQGTVAGQGAGGQRGGGQAAPSQGAPAQELQAIDASLSKLDSQIGAVNGEIAVREDAVAP